MVTATTAQIVRAFGTVVDLQPIRWCDDGLICAPWLAPERATRAAATCPFPLVACRPEPVVPDSAAALVAGWYRRTDLHAALPAGGPLRELVQVAGEGFGPADHPTTAMCLAALALLPDGAALDVGCGSGLLAQAWAASGRGPAAGLDADPAAIAQAHASAVAAGLHPRIGWSAGRIERLDPHELAAQTVLANLPPVAHAALAGRLGAPPRAAVLSGFTLRDDASVSDPYLRRGMRTIARMRRGRWACRVLVRA